MNILLRNQIKVLFNTIRTQRTQNIIGFAIGMIIIGIFVFWFGNIVWSVSGDVPPMMLESILSFGFLAILGMIILMGLPQVFKSLYAGSDLEMLFTMPIPTRNIFWVKYIQSYFGTPFFIYVIFAIPMTIYGIAIKAHFLFYPVALLALFAITLISLSIIYLLNLLLIQIMPPSRANEFMTVMSFLSGLIVYFIFILPGTMSDEPLTERLFSGLPILPSWVPVSWGSSAIAKALEGSLAAFVSLALLFVLAIIMMILTTMLVEKGFRTGWIRLSERSSKKRKSKKSAEGHPKLNHPIIAIGKKEWHTVKRDLREWLTLMPILFLLVFGVIGFITGGGSLSDVRGYGEISWPIAQAILLFLYALTNGSIAAASIGREGPNLWISQVLPISGKQLAYGKFWISWLIPFLIVTIIEIAAMFLLGWTVWQFIAGVVVKSFIAAGVSAMGLWLGTLGAKYNPTNPQQRLNFGVSILLFVLSYIYLIIAMLPVGYLVIPEIALDEIPQDLDHGITGIWGILATIALKALVLKISHPFIMTVVGIIVLLIFSIGAAYGFLLLTARRIDKGLKIDLVSETSSKSLRRPRGKKGGSLY